MTLEEALAKITALEKEKSDLSAALAQEKARATPTPGPAPELPKPGVTARQLAKAEEELATLRKEVEELRKKATPEAPAAKKGGFLKAR